MDPKQMEISTLSTFSCILMHFKSLILAFVWVSYETVHCLSYCFKIYFKCSGNQIEEKHFICYFNCLSGQFFWRLCKILKRAIAGFWNKRGVLELIDGTRETKSPLRSLHEVYKTSWDLNCMLNDISVPLNRILWFSGISKRCCKSHATQKLITNGFFGCRKIVLLNNILYNIWFSLFKIKNCICEKFFDMKNLISYRTCFVLNFLVDITRCT